jgi:hypothetical protein
VLEALHMTPEDLSALLSSLGDTPDAVAETLRREGCQGRPFNPWFCPVSVFLGKRTGLRAAARALRCDVEPPAGGFVCCETPAPVRLFMGGFDRGEYPDLQLSKSTVTPPTTQPPSGGVP